jgi:hypothetical protein
MRNFTPTTTQLRRRGVTALLAMLFLVLMSAVSLGFFATTSMSVQVSGNEARAQRAMVAADAGAQFVRYHLWDLTIPPFTQEENLMNEVYNQLADRLDGTTNLVLAHPLDDPDATGAVVEMPDANTIELPGGGKFIDLGNGQKFRARLTRVGKKVRVRVFGAYKPAGTTTAAVTSARGIQLDFDVAEKASSIFDYGLAARGKVSTGGSTWVKGATDASKGSVMSAAIDPLNPTVTLSGRGISGSVSYIEGSAQPSIHPSTSVGGTSNQTEIWDDYVATLTEPPLFPAVDVSLFDTYATNVYDPAESTSPYVNMRIPAGTNPSFGDGDVILGILFIEMPNVVTFSGKVNIQGMIVADPNGTTDLTANAIHFSGTGGTKQGVGSLPAGDARFDGLRDLTGSFILAPETAVTITGNFGAVNGSIVADKISVTGSAWVDVKGSLITLDDASALSVWGSGDIVISSTGTNNYPAGLRFGSNYYPVPGSYVEVPGYLLEANP